jgi:hypothetical protein
MALLIDGLGRAAYGARLSARVAGATARLGDVDAY